MPAGDTHHRGRLLIADDNATNQLVAGKMARRLGYTCETAANGLEALLALEQQDFDAVLMDCDMPHMDGFEATRELRRRENGHRHTPVIAVTAGVRADGLERCVVAGMDDYMTKPISRACLEALLDRWANQASKYAAQGGACPSEVS